jgi:DMSO reductase anchor subunit
MIISCSWHGATSARLWYASCSHPKMCHHILCPLFQACCISCILLCREFCHCGIAAPCVAGIVIAWMNQQNKSEASLHCVSTTWFFLVSLLLPGCNFVYAFLYGLYFGSHFSKLAFFSMVPNISSIVKGTTKCKIIFSTHKSFHIYNIQNLDSSLLRAQTQIEAAKYQLSR